MNAHLSAILYVVGLYTFLGLPQFFLPRLFLENVTFGAQTADPLTLLLARHWALLAALLGGLLVYAVHHPEVRAPAMFIAAVEKLALAGLVFFGGWQRTAAATRLAVADAVMGVVLLLALAGL
jgi:hypothetical protein